MTSMRQCWGVCVLGWLGLMVGCAPVATVETPSALQPDDTIGSLSMIYYFEAIPLRGIGIVAGLHGTGSSECPPRIRRDLEKYIWKQLSSKGMISASAFIDSKDTAVVEVFGVIPSLVSGRETFDVAVRPLAGTQTTSLDGGHLYTTDLKELSRLANLEQFTAYSKTFATVEGPIYSNKLSGPTRDTGWFVLGGAKVLESEKITLVLNNPDYRVAGLIRNRINERFGRNIAVAINDAQINLFIPRRYHSQKERFLQMVRSLAVGTSPAFINSRIETLVAQLAAQPGNDMPEIALEATGRGAAAALATLLEHPDEAVRFRAARCLLNIDDDRGLAVLRDILLDRSSAYRYPAIEAVADGPSGTASRSVLMTALTDSDIQVRLAAYEALLQAASPVINRTLVAGSFAVDSVACAGPNIIYVYQQQTPRIVLFGAPIECRKNLFVQSDDGQITINAKPGDRFVAVSRQHPSRPRVVGPMKTGYELSLLLQTLGERPTPNRQSGVRPGLALGYDDIIVLLKKLCDTGAVEAQFLSGPPVTVPPMLENLPPLQG